MVGCCPRREISVRGPSRRCGCHPGIPNTWVPVPAVTAAPIRSSSRGAETRVGALPVAREVTDGVQTDGATDQPGRGRPGLQPFVLRSPGLTTRQVYGKRKPFPLRRLPKTRNYGGVNRRFDPSHLRARRERGDEDGVGLRNGASDVRPDRTTREAATDEASPAREEYSSDGYR